MQRAQGVRITWDQIPPRVRDAIETQLGGRVVEAWNQQGGFSPGLAARIRTESGNRVFLKAAGPDLNPVTPAIHRRESRIAAALPSDAPVPRFLWSLDEGGAGWIVLAFEDVDGRLPSHPWDPAELERAVAAIAAMHRALTPSPIDLPPAAIRLSRTLNGWARLRSDEPGLDDWPRRHLETLTALEAEAPEAASGTTMIHIDLRADNILLTDTDVVIVDWPSAAVGAPWIDMIGMAPSVALEGGPPPEEFFRLHPASREAHPHRVTAVVASIAGYFTYNALQPPPPGLPTLRDFQAAQGAITRRWLAERLNLT
ncbi:MAG TPA: aminoglycoside phosphotransferase family protein [Chloroflexota bacterium]|nr:aminoglycoside phosphotransferase family protein [Chloroflexota bacterium]